MVQLAHAFQVCAGWCKAIASMSQTTGRQTLMVWLNSGLTIWLLYWKRVRVHNGRLQERMSTTSLMKAELRTLSQESTRSYPANGMSQVRHNMTLERGESLKRKKRFLPTTAFVRNFGNPWPVRLGVELQQAEMKDGNP
jgi:hypothetical protein